MVRKHTTYTQAHRNYYIRKIRPFREKKVGLDIYSCPLCGMMNNLTRLRDPKLHLDKIYIREGCNWFSPQEYGRLARNPTFEIFIFQKWEELMKDMCNKTFKFLRWAIKYGLITSDRIILELNLNVVEDVSTSEPLKFVNSVNSMNKLPFVDSSIFPLQSSNQSVDSSIFPLQSSNQFVDSSTDSLQSSNQLKPIKSLGGVSNG